MRTVLNMPKSPMIVRHQTPIRKELADELFTFWEGIFGPDDPDIPMGVFLGDEDEHNSHIVFAERDGDVLAGTCGIMTPRANPEFAGIGEVATRPEYRGRGIAGRLCRQALDEFAENCGEAVFLGTENPSAARIYQRLGWRRISNSTVYANIISGASPEEYLADYFRTESQVKIVEGDASLRVPMIPLLLTPHDWQVLDGNLPTPMVSTRYAEQNSCMGLCRKYYYLVKPPHAIPEPDIVNPTTNIVIPAEAGIQRYGARGIRGANWFAAKTDDGRLVGLATAFTVAEGICYVDGFIHKRFIDSYEALVGAAIEWGKKLKAVRFATRLSVEDEEKRAKFEELGFRARSQEGTFILGEREVPAVSMLLE